MQMEMSKTTSAVLRRIN